MKYRIVRRDPCVEVLSCEVDADSPEEAFVKSIDMDWEWEHNESGSMINETEYEVIDEDGEIVYEGD